MELGAYPGTSFQVYSSTPLLVREFKHKGDLGTLYGLHVSGVVEYVAAGISSGASGLHIHQGACC